MSVTMEITTDVAAGGDGEPYFRGVGETGPHPVDIHVGKRLRLRRMTLGMSQSTLGERVGVTFQQIQKYERGANRIGASRLYELSEFLEVPISYFFDDMPGMAFREPAGSTSGATEKDGMRALSAYLGIGDAQIRKSLRNLMRSLGERATARR